MACTGAYATPQQYADFWCLSLDDDGMEATVKGYLEIAASDIDVALASADMCDCSMATWANTLLAKLNIVDAVIYHNCPCGNPRISDDMKQAYMRWIDTVLERIRMMELELCDGETGKAYPVVGWAEQGVTEFAQGEIIIKDALRNSG